MSCLRRRSVLLGLSSSYWTVSRVCTPPARLSGALFSVDGWLVASVACTDANRVVVHVRGRGGREGHYGGT